MTQQYTCVYVWVHACQRACGIQPCLPALSHKGIAHQDVNDSTKFIVLIGNTAQKLKDNDSQDAEWADDEMDEEELAEEFASMLALTPEAQRYACWLRGCNQRRLTTGHAAPRGKPLWRRSATAGMSTKWCSCGRRLTARNIAIPSGLTLAWRWTRPSFSKT